MNTEYAIIWKRKPGIYEPGATGPKWCPLPPERWSVFRKYSSEERRDAVFFRVIEKNDDAEWRRLNL